MVDFVGLQEWRMKPWQVMVCSPRTTSSVSGYLIPSMTSWAAHPRYDMAGLHSPTSNLSLLQHPSDRFTCATHSCALIFLFDLPCGICGIYPPLYSSITFCCTFLSIVPIRFGSPGFLPVHRVSTVPAVTNTHRQYHILLCARLGGS